MFADRQQNKVVSDWVYFQAARLVRKRHPGHTIALFQALRTQILHSRKLRQPTSQHSPQQTDACSYLDRRSCSLSMANSA